MIHGWDLGYQEQNVAFTCTDMATGRELPTLVCRGKTNKATEAIMALQRDLGALYATQIRFENGIAALARPSIDGAVGPETVQAVKLAADAGIAKYEAIPSVPPARDGSHDGLTTAEFRVILLRGVASEIATWAKEISAYIRGLISMEQISRTGPLIVAPPMQSLAPQTESSSSSSWPWIVGLGIALAAAGGLVLMKRPRRRK